MKWNKLNDGTLEFKYRMHPVGYTTFTIHPSGKLFINSELKLKAPVEECKIHAEKYINDKMKTEGGNIKTPLTNTNTMKTITITGLEVEADLGDDVLESKSPIEWLELIERSWYKKHLADFKKLSKKVKISSFDSVIGNPEIDECTVVFAGDEKTIDELYKLLNTKKSGVKVKITSKMEEGGVFGYSDTVNYMHAFLKSAGFTSANDSENGDYDYDMNGNELNCVNKDVADDIEAALESKGFDVEYKETNGNHVIKVNIKHKDGDKNPDQQTIPNNYEGKTTEQVWDSWSPEQREHFLLDHMGYDKDVIDIKPYVNATYEQLKSNNWNALIDKISAHVEQGQYAKGGKIKNTCVIVTAAFKLSSDELKSGKENIKNKTLDESAKRYAGEEYGWVGVSIKDKHYDSISYKFKDEKHANKFIKDAKKIKGIKFDKRTDEYATGGEIKNQYQGRSATDVWNSMTEQQRGHFITDHAVDSSGIVRIHMKDRLAGTLDKSFDELHSTIQAVLREHVASGEYAKGGRIGEKMKISDLSGVDSNKIVTIVSNSNIKMDGRGIPTNVSGAYKSPDWNKQQAIQYENGEYGIMFKNRLEPIKAEGGEYAAGGEITSTTENTLDTDKQALQRLITNPHISNEIKQEAQETLNKIELETKEVLEEGDLKAAVRNAKTIAQESSGDFKNEAQEYVEQLSEEINNPGGVTEEIKTPETTTTPTEETTPPEPTEVSEAIHRIEEEEQIEEEAALEIVEKWTDAEVAKYLGIDESEVTIKTRQDAVDKLVAGGEYAKGGSVKTKDIVSVTVFHSGDRDKITAIAERYNGKWVAGGLGSDDCFEFKNKDIAGKFINYIEKKPWADSATIDDEYARGGEIYPTKEGNEEYKGVFYSIWIQPRRGHIAKYANRTKNSSKNMLHILPSDKTKIGDEDYYSSYPEANEAAKKAIDTYLINPEDYLAKGGAIQTPTKTNTQFDKDVDSWFGDLVNFSKQAGDNETFKKLLALTYKTASESNLKKFRKLVKSCDCPNPELKKHLLNQLNKVLKRKYKGEFKNAFGGKPGNVTKVSAASSFLDKFKQAATYGEFKEGGKVKPKTEGEQLEFLKERYPGHTYEKQRYTTKSGEIDLRTLKDNESVVAGGKDYYWLLTEIKEHKEGGRISIEKYLNYGEGKQLGKLKQSSINKFKEKIRSEFGDRLISLNSSTEYIDYASYHVKVKDLKDGELKKIEQILDEIIKPLGLDYVSVIIYPGEEGDIHITLTNKIVSSESGMLYHSEPYAKGGNIKTPKKADPDDGDEQPTDTIEFKPGGKIMSKSNVHKDHEQYCNKASVIQTILFPKDKFNILKARKWLKKHDYKYSKLDKTTNNYRFRQVSPTWMKRDTFRTISFGDSGIKAVIGCLKERHMEEGGSLCGCGK